METILAGKTPDGFAVDFVDRNLFSIEYRRTGMKNLNFFLVAWLSIWTIGCLFAVKPYLVGAKSFAGDPGAVAMLVVMLVAEVLVLCFLAFVFFCRRSFLFDEMHLVVETRVLFVKRAKAFVRTEIERLIQTRDGGTSEDSFPSWGLKIVSGRETGLIFRQPYEKSCWLGEVVAAWANVPFIREPRPEMEA